MTPMDIQKRCHGNPAPSWADYYLAARDAGAGIAQAGRLADELVQGVHQSAPAALYKPTHGGYPG